MTQWQRNMASPFTEACDKRPLQLSAESDTFAPHTASPDIFNASKCKCSLEDKLLSRFLEHCDGDAWPHPSPQASLLIPEAWYLLRSFRGNWSNLQHAWRSLLAMPGWVLYHRTDKIGYFVLQSSRYSCVTWRPCIRCHGSVYFIRLGDVDVATAAEAPWQQLHMTALDEWRVMIPRPLTHAQAERLVGDAASSGITLVFMFGEESKPLLRTAAETAFKALTRHFLGLLWDDLCRDTDARKPTTEFDLCFQLVKKVLPHLSNADTFELVGTRGLKTKPEFDTFITEDNLAHIAQGVDEEVTLEIQEKLVEKTRVFKTRATPTTTTHGPSANEAGPSASFSNSASPARVRVKSRACCLHS